MSYTSGIDSQQTIKLTTPPGTQSAEAVNRSSPVTNKHEAISATLPHADETALSSTAGLIYESLGSSDARTVKVSSLQEAIAFGSYTVPSSDVADKVIQSLLNK